VRNERSQVLLFGFGKVHDELAGRIVVLGYRALRANEIENAVDLIRRQDQPVRVLMFPPEAPFADRPNDLRRLAEASGALGLRSIVSGTQPTASAIAALKRDGVRFALWKGFHDAELRFTLNAALYDETRGQMRPALRVPASLMARIKSGAGEKAGMLYNLSSTGAFIETPRPSMPGGRITLTIEFTDGPVATPANVVFANVPGNLQKPNLPLGMGVKFAGITAEAAERVAKYIAERARSYEL
jgi:Tfp pilus assembly protein PilZ